MQCYLDLRFRNCVPTETKRDKHIAWEMYSGEFEDYFLLTLFFLVLTVGRSVAELWSRLLLFQLFQLAGQLSNMS